ncbi:MAG: RNA polymerase sigma factor RpoD/SigA [Candidatus Latescibacterota bacterium]|jgi:RNA polymerase primary sigma factor
MDVYWRDIQHFQPLSRAKETELVARARAGDEEAFHALVNANLRFVVRVAKEYTHCGLSFTELVSEGNHGLIEAVSRFDETLGYKFITYAVWWIRQAILKALAQQGKAARPPMSQVNDLQKVERQAAALGQKLGRSPTLAELATGAEMTEERVRHAVEVGQRDLSFDAPVYLDDDESLLSVFPVEEVGADEKLDRAELAAALHRSLEALDSREQRIVRAYYGLDSRQPMTLEQIGATLGLTRERIRQLRDRALQKIRARSGLALLELSRN